ncbi:glycosyltransferase family 2 protein [Pseudodesulfovibrio sp.]|uniref:glycosyltransferase family 2 protein n=1 Tax=Pseudodesulfovibrio sp. TaxID=2035812 RepID=UPI002607EC08|nr:glycosyltransferase family 2 protein [Pseudodesulfovibrio sp.]MDD3312408.1 glycosyltransferase family 2 protein [Pseudodesulfovibrio sp.]
MSARTDRPAPRVSIGMPVYNGGERMRRAVDSLLAQDFEDFELVISDNASTDGTWDLCREYAARDPRVRISRNADNEGIMANFKKVLALSAGEYFMWAAFDDLWLPSFLARLTADLDAHPEAGVTLCRFDVVDEEGEPMFTFGLDERHDPNRLGRVATARLFYSRLKVNYYFYGLFRRALLDAHIGEYVPIVAVERWFLAKLALVAPFRYVDEVLHVRTHSRIKFANRYPDDPLSRVFVAQTASPVTLAPFASVARFALASPDVRPWVRLGVVPLFFAYAGRQLGQIRHRLRLAGRRAAHRFLTQKTAS